MEFLSYQSLTSSTGMTMNGIMTANSVGDSISSAGDVNGDGKRI